MAAPAARRGPGRPPNSKPPTHPLGSPGRGSGARHGLPYDPDALHWVHAHTQNLEGLYCYCGSDRNLNEANLQCGGCRNWFHASCLSPALRALPLAPFVTDYSFTCALCVRKEKKMKDADGEWPGEERFQRTAGSWEHSVVAAIANLALRKMQEAKRSMHDPNIPEGDKAYYFEKNRDVCPYIDKNWKALCPQRERSANAWTVVGSTLFQSKALFAPWDPKSRSVSAPFTLCERNLYLLRPGFIEALDQSQQAAQPAAEVARSKKDKKRQIGDENAAADPDAAAFAFFDSVQGLGLPAKGAPKTVEEMQRTYVSPDNWDIEHPYNKDGYKYDFGESNPPTSFKQTHFRPQQHFRSRAGQSPVFLSPTDRSTQIEVSPDGLTATNKAGFRSVRSNVGVKEGSWYFEVKILKGGAEGRADPEGRTGANVRLGWTRREATLGAPIGYDSYGYGYRDLTGDKLHESEPTAYGEAFGTGDVIGCYISLPPMKTNLRPGQKKEKTEEDTPQLLGKLSDLPPEALSPFRQKRNRPPIKYRLGLFLESRDYQPINIPPLLTHMMTGSKASLKSHSTPITQRTLPWYASLLSKDFPTLKGSYISFYKNGKPQGVAFSDIAAPIPAAAAVPEQHRKPLESFLPDPPIADDGSIGYYPTVSLFSGGSVRLNFGPDFEFPPTDLGKKGKWRPMCERLADREAEETLCDLLDEATAAPLPLFYGRRPAREDTPSTNMDDDGDGPRRKKKRPPTKKEEIKVEK